MSDEYQYLKEMLFTGFRAWPVKIIFVMESDKYKVIVDVGLGGRFKKNVIFESDYSPPDPHSMNEEERSQARAAKLVVMDTFMGQDGVGLVQEKGERLVLRQLLYRGTTSHEVAVINFEKSGSFVDAGKYMEVLRAYDFDRSVSDFVYGGV